MRRIVNIVLWAGIGLAIAGALLAVGLPWLIRAGYLAVGSPRALWIIGPVIVVCVTLMVYLSPGASSAKPRLDD